MSGISVRALVHRHPGFTLGPLDLDAAPGEIHALLGPNGSGKTTLLEVLTGWRPAHEGTVLTNGRVPDPDDADRYRELAFVPADDRSVPLELTATELWDVCAVLLGGRGSRSAALRRGADDLAHDLDLDPPGRPMAEYSHGMRTKTRLVASLLGQPSVVLLDEPNAGLDPVAGHRLGRVLRDRAATGTTVLVASHDLAWVHQFADRATVLAGGRTVASGPTDHVLGPVGEGSLLERFLATVR
jgi:ABC-2 type transport system ATP-binding protein